MADPTQRQVKVFVPVVQRRLLAIEPRFLHLLEPLFLIPSHTTFEERLWLFGLALSLPQGFVACEVGSYLGSSACFLAAAATLREGRVHCVDTWDGRAMGAEEPADSYADFLADTRPFRHYVTPHRGLAAEQAAHVPGGLDLVFLDGDHDREAVLSDLAGYVPKLRPGGLLALHDFTFDSVRQAAAEFFAGKQPIDKGGVHSLRVLQPVGP